MGRSGGGGSRGGGGSFSYRGSTPSRKTSSKPAVRQEPAPTPAKAGDTKTGLGESLADGFGWGFGMNAAQRVSDFFMGPRVVKVENAQSSAPAVSSRSSSDTALGGSDGCSATSKIFVECLNSNASDISRCQSYMDMLIECRRMNTGSVSSAASVF